MLLTLIEERFQDRAFRHVPALERALSREALEQRLIDRGTDDMKTIESRMMQADGEMSHCGDAEYVVVNVDFKRALNDLESIIHTQSLTLSRQKSKFKDLFDSIPDEIG